MGEYAEATLNGDACAECGFLFDDAGGGFPRYCKGCGPADRRPVTARVKTLPCLACDRNFVSAFALAQHRAMKGH